MHEVPRVLGDEGSGDLLLFPEFLLGELAVAPGHSVFHPLRQFWDLVPTPQDLIQLALAHVASQHAAVALVDEAVDKGFWDGEASANLPPVTAPEFVDVVQDPFCYDVV